MLNNAPFILLIMAVYGCAGPLPRVDVDNAALSESSTRQDQMACPGSAELPEALAGSFEAVQDDALLKSVLGAPEEGKLCQGKVYRVTGQLGVKIYRAWNSSNPKSNTGNWWAFYQPAGSVAQYRNDYEICYQWSPLDKLTHCTLSAGTKVVVGTGQSARCSDYLTYPVSAAKQLYLPDVASSVSGCKNFDAIFDWQPVAE